MSLAGTQLFIENKIPHWTHKEEKEQNIVTQMIVNTLQPITEELFVDKTHNLRAGNLWHLCNKISAKILPQTTVNQIINSLHPTPAVCGFPTEKAYEFILKNESYSREFYTGFCGLLNFQNVGGGINKDSRPQDEWQETQNKAQTILKVLFS